MKSADCIVMCSQFEGFSMVVVEGMLLGRPVIAANSGSIPELIDHLQTGLTYEHANLNEFVDRLKFVYRERAAAEQIAGRARAWAARTFRQDAYYQAFYRLLAEARRDSVRRLAHEGAEPGTGAGASL
jgi:glycosyltransferase involved in cell wall biosynthesis